MNDQSDSKIKVKSYTKRALVSGVGINNANYAVKPRINGKVVTCPFYARWVSMLSRCYCSKVQESYPNYQGCYVVEDWLTFSIFKEWMEQQNWEGKHLDKDLLVEGNKCYSSETCVFVTSKVNSFLTDRANCRGSLPIGVDLHKGKYRASCNDKGSQVHLGYYDTPELAHLAWYTYKSKLAKKLASEQTDPRIAEALLSRFPETTYESTDSQLLNN